MASVMITGSTDGLGLMAARLLLDEGHGVTLHARSAARAEDVRRAEPPATAVLVGDLARPSPAGCPPGWAVLAPRDDLALAPVTQAWLAVSDDPAAMVTGGYFYHQRPREPNPAARD